MSIELFEHNRQAYDSAVAMLAGASKTCVVHPTGTGKSFIGFKLCEDNPEKTVCWLSPSDYIFRTQLENLAAAADGWQPGNIRFFTYAKLINMTDSEIADIKPDHILIRCDIDEYELSRSIKDNEQEYQTDAKLFLEMLLAEDIGDFSEWRDRCFKARDFLSSYDKQEGNKAVEAISALLPGDPIVTADVGMNQCWCAQSLLLKGHRGRIHISGGYGTMGCSLPFAIGASISAGGAPVFCITGDGGLQMNIQELETVKREQLPIKILVLNNRVLGKISETQQLEHGGRFASTTAHSGYSVPDFKGIAEAYGIRAASLDSYKELPEYGEWFRDSEPCLIDISLPENSRLTPKIQFDTLITTPKLESSVLDEVRNILTR